MDRSMKDEGYGKDGLLYVSGLERQSGLRYRSGLGYQSNNGHSCYEAVASGLISITRLDSGGCFVLAWVLIFQ
jgi:hypothetical protein